MLIKKSSENDFYCMFFIILGVQKGYFWTSKKGVKMGVKNDRFGPPKSVNNYDFGPPKGGSDPPKNGKTTPKKILSKKGGFLTIYDVPRFMLI